MCRETHRHLLLSLTIAAVLNPVALRSDEVKPVELIWASDLHSPAICVEKNNWFIGVVPDSLNMEGLDAPKVAIGSEVHGSKFLYLDPIQRLCFLATMKETGAQPATIAVSPGPKPGHVLICNSLASSCSTIVAGKEWSYRGDAFALPLLRLRLGDSMKRNPPGTVLLNDKGTVEGLLTDHKLEAENEALAIPASRIRKLVRDIKRHERSGPIWVGLVFHNESSSPEVIAVRENSPASKAGLEEGDVILSVNGLEVETLDELCEAVHSLPAGEKVALEVLRGLEDKTMSIVPQFAEATY